MVRGGLADGWALYRISDGSSGKKPFDIGGCSPQGHAVAIEAKVIRTGMTPSTIPWCQFESHQVSWLKLYSSINGMALAALYYEHTKSLHVIYLNSPDVFDWPINQLTNFYLRRQTQLWRGWNQIFKK